MKSNSIAASKKSGRIVDTVRELPSDPTVDWLWEELPDTYWDSTDEPLNEEWDVAISPRNVPEMPPRKTSIN